MGKNEGKNISIFKNTKFTIAKKIILDSSNSVTKI